MALIGAVRRTYPEYAIERAISKLLMDMHTTQEKKSVILPMFGSTATVSGDSGGTVIGPRPPVILVVGASGGVGKRVVEALLRRGKHVRALVRDADKGAQLLVRRATRWHSLKQHPCIAMAYHQGPYCCQGDQATGVPSVLIRCCHVHEEVAFCRTHSHWFQQKQISLTCSKLRCVGAPQCNRCASVHTSAHDWVNRWAALHSVLTISTGDPPWAPSQDIKICKNRAAVRTSTT